MLGCTVLCARVWSCMQAYHIAFVVAVMTQCVAMGLKMQYYLDSGKGGHLSDDYGQAAVSLSHGLFLSILLLMYGRSCCVCPPVHCCAPHDVPHSAQRVCVTPHDVPHSSQHVCV